MIHIPEKQAATKLRNIGLNNERESMRHSVRESSDFHIKILEIFMLLFPLLRIFKFSAYNLQSGKIVSVNSSIDSVSDTRWCWICLFVKFEEEHILDLSLFLPSPLPSLSFPGALLLFSNERVMHVFRENACGLHNGCNCILMRFRTSYHFVCHFFRIWSCIIMRWDKPFYR